MNVKVYVDVKTYRLTSLIIAMKLIFMHVDFIYTQVKLHVLTKYDVCLILSLWLKYILVIWFASRKVSLELSVMWGLVMTELRTETSSSNSVVNVVMNEHLRPELAQQWWASSNPCALLRRVSEKESLTSSQQTRKNLVKIKLSIMFFVSSNFILFFTKYIVRQAIKIAVAYFS